MQRAELNRTFFVVAMLAGAATAGAQTAPAVSASPMTPPSAVALAPVSVPNGPGSLSGAEPREATPASMAERARHIAIGRVDGEANATLQELINLQQQQYLQELRAKMTVVGPATVATGAVPGALTPPAIIPTIPEAAPLESDVLAASAASMNPEPEAKVMSIIVTNGRGRADVLKAGIVSTIKEGDKLDQWTVTAIRLEGVTVETTVTGLRPDSSPGSSKAGRKGKSAMVEYEKKVTATLKMAVAESLGTPVVVSASAATPVVPPLPAPIRPVDSTSVPAPKPLN